MDAYLRAVTSREELDKTATRHLRYTEYLATLCDQLRDLIPVSDYESKILYEYNSILNL